MQQLSHSASAFCGAPMPDSFGNHLPFIYFPIAAVRQATGISTSRIYALIKEGEFPTGDLIGKQSRRWKSTDIAAWLNRQAALAEKREFELSAPLRRKAENGAAKSAANRAARACGGAA